MLDAENVPSSDELNRLLARCNEETHPRRKLLLALQQSSFHLSIFKQSTGRLVGFVRATSDQGLNANLWNLVAEPSNDREQIVIFLVYQSLSIIKREMPGCSVSVSAPVMAIEALEGQGFLVDPNGIRAMGLRLR